RAVIEFAVLELRPVLAVPETTAEAFSTTRMVIRSSIWLARRSRAASGTREPGVQIPPAEAAGASAVGARASATKRSSGDGVGGLTFFLAANVLTDNNRIKIRIFIGFPSSPPLCLWTRHAPESAVAKRDSGSGRSRQWRPSLRPRIPVRAVPPRGQPLHVPSRRAAQPWRAPTTPRARPFLWRRSAARPCRQLPRRHSPGPRRGLPPASPDRKSGGEG